MNFQEFADTRGLTLESVMGDAWVAEDGSHRIALTAGQARRDHATGPLTGGVWDRCYLLDGEIHEDGPERFLG